MPPTTTLKVSALAIPQANLRGGGIYPCRKVGGGIARKAMWYRVVTRHPRWPDLRPPTSGVHPPQCPTNALPCLRAGSKAQSQTRKVANGRTAAKQAFQQGQPTASRVLPRRHGGQAQGHQGGPGRRGAAPGLRRQAPAAPGGGPRGRRCGPGTTPCGRRDTSGVVRRPHATTTGGGAAADTTTGGHCPAGTGPAGSFRGCRPEAGGPPDPADPGQPRRAR